MIASCQVFHPDRSSSLLAFIPDRMGNLSGYCFITPKQKNIKLKKIYLLDAVINSADSDKCFWAIWKFQMGEKHVSGRSENFKQERNMFQVDLEISDSVEIYFNT